MPQLRSEVQADEPICRYLLSSKEYAPSTGRVKPRAFYPAHNDHKTSVFRILGLDDQNIWKIGDKEVANPRGRALRARADLTVSNVLEVGLSVEADEPPPRHANVSSWPQGKHVYLSLAQELAASAKLHLRD